MLGPENRLTLNTRGNLAVALIAQGKLREAGAEYKDVMNWMERVLGLDHPDTFSYATKFTTSLSRQNRFDDAKTLAKQIEQAASQKLGLESASAQSYANLLADLEHAKQWGEPVIVQSRTSLIGDFSRLLTVNPDKRALSCDLLPKYFPQSSSTLAHSRC